MGNVTFLPVNAGQIRDASDLAAACRGVLRQIERLPEPDRIGTLAGIARIEAIEGCEHAEAGAFVLGLLSYAQAELHLKLAADRGLAVRQSVQSF